LKFEIHTSQTTSNANTTVDVVNTVDYRDSGEATNRPGGQPFLFGSGTLVSNLYFLFPGTTNWFQLAKLGDNVTYETSGTNVVESETNAIYGVRIEDVASFIAGFTAALTQSTSTADTNAGTSTAFISKVVGVTTNIIKGSTSSSSDPGTLTYSNAWYEVAGVLNGSIKAGKATYKFPKDTPAIFTTEHNLYDAFLHPIVRETNAWAEEYTTNGSVITTNVVQTTNIIFITNLVQAVRVTPVTGSSISLEPMDSLHGALVRFGKKFWTTGTDPIDGSGKGSVSASSKATNYTANIKGVSRSKGGSLKLTGTTDPNYIAGYTGLTNVITVTNQASIGAVSATFTNETLHTLTLSDYYRTTNAVVVLGTTNVAYTVFSDNFFNQIVTPPLIVTNIDGYGIRMIKSNGKVKGQTLPKDVPGINADNPFPED
jgi:hypothetical protein